MDDPSSVVMTESTATETTRPQSYDQVSQEVTYASIGGIGLKLRETFFAPGSFS